MLINPEVLEIPESIPLKNVVPERNLLNLLEQPERDILKSVLEQPERELMNKVLVPERDLLNKVLVPERILLNNVQPERNLLKKVLPEEQLLDDFIVNVEAKVPDQGNDK